MGDDLERFREFLGGRDLRLTRQRTLVASTLLGARDHLSADDVAARLRGRGVSKSTVYRTLQLLVDSGLVDGQEYGDGRLYYEMMVGRDHHDHLVCLGCGELTEFQNPEIETIQDKVAGAHDFQVVSHTHKLFGYCARCRTGRARPSEAGARRPRRGRMGFFTPDAKPSERP